MNFSFDELINYAQEYDGANPIYDTIKDNIEEIRPKEITHNHYNAVNELHNHFKVGKYEASKWTNSVSGDGILHLPPSLSDSDIHNSLTNLGWGKGSNQKYTSEAHPKTTVDLKRYRHPTLWVSTKKD
jgi:hypothetical protein